MAGNWEDVAEVRELASAYSAAAGRMDAKALAAFFTADARVTGLAQAFNVGGDLVGPAAIDAFFSGMFRQVESVTQMLHAANIEVSGNSATGVADIVEYVKYGGVPGFTVVVARYEDEYRKTLAGWRFAARAFTLKILAQVSDAASG
jgi:ketosteroid isomerase-like protein